MFKSFELIFLFLFFFFFWLMEVFIQCKFGVGLNILLFKLKSSKASKIPTLEKYNGY